MWTRLVSISGLISWLEANSEERRRWTDGFRAPKAGLVGWVLLLDNHIDFFKSYSHCKDHQQFWQLFFKSATSNRSRFIHDILWHAQVIVSRIEIKPYESCGSLFFTISTLNKTDNRNKEYEFKFETHEVWELNKRRRLGGVRSEKCATHIKRERERKWSSYNNNGMNQERERETKRWPVTSK